jgi:hypothetical protein
MKPVDPPLRAKTLMLQLLAWVGEQDVRGLLAPFLRPTDPPPLESALEQVLHTLLNKALARLEDDDLVGPVLLALARHCLKQIDFSLIVAFLSIDGMLDARCSLAVENVLAAHAVPRYSTSGEETKVFWEAVAGSWMIDAYLKQLSQSWRGNVCLGAQNLPVFFLHSLDLLQWTRPMPFFLYALLQRSLVALHWHAVAAKIMGVAPAACQCSTHADSLVDARIAWLAQVCWEVKDMIMREHAHLPKMLQTDVEAFEEACFALYEALERALKKGEARAIPPEQLSLFWQKDWPG